jgi:hypothetical protein
MVNDLLRSHLNTQRVVLKWLTFPSARCTVQVALIPSISLFEKGGASPGAELGVLPFATDFFLYKFQYGLLSVSVFSGMLIGIFGRLSSFLFLAHFLRLFLQRLPPPSLLPSLC